MAGSLICCHSCALKWSHLRANSAIRAFHTQSFPGCVCERARTHARTYDEDCAYERVSRFSGDLTSKEFGHMVVNTYTQRERQDERQPRSEPEKVVSLFFFF